MRFFKRKVVWVPLAALLSLVVVMAFFNKGESHEQTSFGDVLALVRSGDVESIESRGRKLDITLRDWTELESRRDMTVDLVAALERNDAKLGGGEPDSIDVQFERSGGAGGFFVLLVNCIPLVVLIVVMYYAVRNAVRTGMRSTAE